MNDVEGPDAGGKAASLRRPLGRRLVILVVLFSSAITLLLTAGQLYLDYRHDRADIETRLAEIPRVHLASIADALWVADYERLSIQLSGIQKLPDMVLLEIHENGRKVMSVGDEGGRGILRREHPIIHPFRGDARVIGRLTVIASLDGMYRRLVGQALTILVSNAIKTFFVAGFMLMMLDRLVTSRLRQFVRFLEQHRAEDAAPAFLPANGNGADDELSVTFDAYNDMNRRISDNTALLRQSEERFREIAENVGDMVWIVSPDWREFLYINPAYGKIWGRSVASLISDPTSWTLGLDAQDKAAVEETIENARAALDAGKRLRRIDFATYTVTRPDGTQSIVFARAFPIWNEAGKVERIVGINTDLTELLRAQQELSDSEKKLRRAQRLESIGHLTGGVAHDFNNLLAVMLGNLELLRDDPGQEGAVAMIDAAIGAVERGSDLTRNMLSFARQASLAPESLDLNTVVRATEDWLRRTLPATIKVETSLLAGLWRIEADLGSTQSALLNLIVNARDAMPEGGRLTIETSNLRIDDDYIADRDEEFEPGRYVMLAVSDTGTGIPPDVLENIFDPFFTTKATGKGSGLGLSMVLGFMKQSGGTARVYSEPGVGTTFKLYFKASSKAAPRASAPARPADAPAEGRRILVAEDQREVLATLIDTLQRAGYAVSPAASGDEAKRIFAEDREFDLLLTDIVMPGTLQGPKLAKELRLMRDDLPVVFMSGYAEEATVHGNGLRPEDIRLMKPVRRGDLLNAIALALAGGRKRS